MMRLLPRISQENPAPLLASGIPPLLARVLWSRGVHTAEAADAFLFPRLEDLNDPFCFMGMDDAVRRIQKAIAQKEHIAVYGDYDVDGVCATTILVESLRQNGADVSYYIPSRHREGYGLNREAALMLSKKAHLIITVDCGMTNVEEAALIQKSADLIITDHHEPPAVHPEAVAIINPLLGGYPFPKLCGAGVAFKLCQALFGFDAVKAQLDLVALATVADLVPLLDENRIFVHFGLQTMQNTKRVGLKALIQAAELSEKIITAGHLGFQLGPRINAGGRINESSRSVEMLLTSDFDAAMRIAKTLCQENNKRRQLEGEILTLAIEEAHAVDFMHDKALLIEGHGWNTGVIGLVASRLVEKFAWPTIVLSESDGICVGSARSIPGVNIHAALTQCEDLFLRFGGHAQAAGLTIRQEDVPALRERLNQAITSIADPSAYLPSASYDLSCRLSDINIPLIEEMERLAPTGFGNPSPVFHLQGVDVLEARNVGADGKHLRLRLLQHGVAMDGIAFGQGDARATLPNQIDMLFSPNINEYMGRRNAQCNVSLMLPHEPLDAFRDLCYEKSESFDHYLIQLVQNRSMYSPLKCKTSSVETRVMEALRASYQGTMLVTYTLEGTIHWLRWLAENGLENRLSFGFFAPDDIRKYNILCALPDTNAIVGYKVLALDVAFIPKAMAAIVPDDAELRALYRTLRDNPNAYRSETAIAQAVGQKTSKVTLGLNVLDELNLITYRASPFQAALLPMRKCSLLDSELLTYARKAT